MSLRNYVFHCTHCNFDFECCTLDSCVRHVKCGKCFGKTKVLRKRGPLLKYECTTCDHIFEHESMDNVNCPLCLGHSVEHVELSVNIIIPRKHRAVPKKTEVEKRGYAEHPLDQGMPFGTVPGDDVHLKGDINSPISPKP